MSQDAASLYEERKLSELENRLGLHFEDKTLLITALSHKSHRGSKLTSKKENKRLGLLGDKIIDLLLYKAMYERGYSLEDMNNQRFATENKWLNVNADMLQLMDYMILEDSADEKIKAESKSFGSDSIEAIVGAIFIDSGFSDTQRFVDQWLVRFMLPIEKE